MPAPSGVKAIIVPEQSGQAAAPCGEQARINGIIMTNSALPAPGPRWRREPSFLFISDGLQLLTESVLIKTGIRKLFLNLRPLISIFYFVCVQKNKTFCALNAVLLFAKKGRNIFHNLLTFP